MMVVENGKDAIEKNMVGLPYAYVRGEQRVYHYEDEQMQLSFEEGVHELQP